MDEVVYDTRMRRYSRFVWGMHYLRTRFPTMSVTSWGRSPAHNKGLPGSDPASQHLEWTAADGVFDPGTEPEHGTLVAAAREGGLQGQQDAGHSPLGLVTGALTAAP